MKKVKKHLKRLAIVTVLALVVTHLCFMRSESWLRSRVVKLSSARGMCSGEQIHAPSGVDYILSAGHCKDLAVNDEMTVTDAEGNVTKRKVIAEDPSSDLLLIEGIPGLRGLDIADSDSAKEHVRTFTHGSNMATFKTEGEIIQSKQIQILVDIIMNEEQEAKCVRYPKFHKISMDTFFGEIKACVMELDETASTASIVPGSSGGMLVDDSGDLVGVASCTDGKFGYFVSLHDIKKFLSGY